MVEYKENSFRLDYLAKTKGFGLLTGSAGRGRTHVSVRYEYDPNGNNTRTILPTGAEILREYDAADRLIMERHIDVVQ